jgi:putative cell wall-binding protein/glucose/arabinose dehydrogenase
LLQLVLTVLIVAATAAPALAAPEIVIDEDFISGVSGPVYVDAPVGDDRVFVVEIGGRIEIHDHITGAFIGTFLDVGPSGLNLIRAGGEQGLMGLAFHPNYAANGKFYLDYIDRLSSPGDVHVVEFTVSGDPNVADPASYRHLLTIAQPRSNHNGGAIAFGSDGYLYIASGDGGKQNDPDNNAQSTSTLLGKILRIDIDTGSPYGIPDGNPYKGVPGLDEIWALGLRNPWRISFDPLKGDLYIGDVGQGAREEVDAIGPTHAGANFGWRILEGDICHEPSSGCAQPAGYVGPIHDYTITSTTRSVIGGQVYRGSVLPDIDGTYFYTDFYTDELWSLEYSGGSGGTVGNLVNWEPIVGPISAVAGIGTDGHGEIYLASWAGRVSKLVLGTDRHWGPDRYSTAANISAEAFPGGASTVYVAFGEDFPDALGAAAAAAEAGGPVLLTKTNSIPASTTAELARLAPTTIVVVGGPAVVSDAVLAQLGAFASTVERHSGANRYATAADISARAFPGGASTVYVALGEDFPDALGAAAAAAQAGGPVLLTLTDSIPAATAAELTRLNPTTIIVAGGPAVVSDAVVASLGAYGTVERHSGADRYATAASISAQAFGGGASTVYVAYGGDFPDALGAAAAAAAANGPVLLVRTGSIPGATATELTRLAPDTIIVSGGPGVISYATQIDLIAYLP